MMMRTRILHLWIVLIMNALKPELSNARRLQSLVDKNNKNDKIDEKINADKNIQKNDKNDNDEVITPLPSWAPVTTIPPTRLPTPLPSPPPSPPPTPPPTPLPSPLPSQPPTSLPTRQPTPYPTTTNPSINPSRQPETSRPTPYPTTDNPSRQPVTPRPTMLPSTTPTALPPSRHPTSLHPTIYPTHTTAVPSLFLSSTPTRSPTNYNLPSLTPTNRKISQSPSLPPQPSTLSSNATTSSHPFTNFPTTVPTLQPIETQLPSTLQPSALTSTPTSSSLQTNPLSDSIRPQSMLSQPPSIRPSKSLPIWLPIGYLVLTMSTLEGIVTSRTATPRVHGWSPIQNELMALLLSVLCNDTDFRLVNNLGDNPCPHDHHSTSQSVVHYGMVSLKEEASATTKFNYTSWAFSFPILSIDVQYMEMATEQARTFNDEISLLDGLNIMQQVAQEALDLRLKVARHSLSKGTYVSVTGEEHMTFERKNTEGRVIEMSNNISSFHPNPLHTLRFAGIVLLCITVVAYLALIRLSNRRRLAREWESKRIKEAKGGLITEPGLDYILDKGKKSGIFRHDNSTAQNLLPEIS